MRAPFQYAVFDWIGDDRPGSGGYDLIRQAGFDGVMLWWGEDILALPPRDKGSFPEQARKAGLSVVNAHGPMPDVNALWRQGLAGDGILDMFLRCVDDCADFQISSLVVHASTGFAPPEPCETGLERIKRLVHHGEKRGVTLSFENLRNTAPLRYILDRIVSPRAGFCYDVGHEHCRTPEEDLLAEYGHRLTDIHLHDNAGMVNRDGADDQHRLPFDGTVDWARAAKSLARLDYGGPLAFEVTTLGHEDMAVDAFLRLAFERAVRVGDKIEAAAHA